MERLVRAFRNSARAWSFLVKNEISFRQEIAVLCVSVPAGWFLAKDWDNYLILISSILLVTLIEVVNTAIEAVCDAVSEEFSEEIRLAKDCGSLAVLISIIIAVSVWLSALADWLNRAQL